MLNKLQLFFLLALIGLTACAPKLTTQPKVDTEDLKTIELVKALDSLSKTEVDFFYSKISTEFKDTNRHISFKTSIRMKCDSALSALIKYASIPIAQVEISLDSLLVSNKREKCYMRNDLSYLQEVYGVELSFVNVQEMLLGLPIDFDKSIKYIQTTNDSGSTVSTSKTDKNQKTVNLKYLLSNKPFELKGMEIISPADSTSIYIQYLSRENVEGINLPKDVQIEIWSPNNHIKLELEYQKSTINNPEPLYFIIPDSYEECK